MSGGLELRWDGHSIGDSSGRFRLWRKACEGHIWYDGWARTKIKCNLYVWIYAVLQVGVPEVRQYRTMPDTQQMSFLSVSTTLFPAHYHNGQLILKCTAHVSTLYRKTTEVHISSRAREPIPERGKLHPNAIIKSGATPVTVRHCHDPRWCCHGCAGFLFVLAHLRTAILVNMRFP
jgi:hypothetical protein